MENNRPRGREKNVTGSGRRVQKRGEGLGTGPVRDAKGYQDRTPQSDGSNRGTGGRGGGMKLVVLLLGGGEDTVTIMVYMCGTDLESRSGMGSVSMTSPDTLSGYIQWCARNYPVSRYELILWDHGGGLLGKAELAESWLDIEGQPVAYYHIATVDDGTNYTVTGRVQVLHNGIRSELILVYDNEHPHGYVVGVCTVTALGRPTQ